MDSHNSTTFPEHPDRPPRRKRRLLRTVLVVLGLLLLLVALLPTILTKTRLLGYLIGQATADLEAKVTVRSASIGWLSNPVIEGVSVEDPEGKLLLEVPRVTGDRSTWALIRNPSDLGRFRLEQPNIHLVVRPDGSNLEDLLASLPASDNSESSGTPKLDVEVVGGKLTLEDARTGATWLLERINVLAQLTDEPDQPMKVDASGSFDPSQGGEVEAAVVWFLEQPTSDSDQHEARFSTDAFPLECLEVVLARWLPELELAGKANVTASGQFFGGTVPSGGLIDATINGRDFRFAQAALGDDRVELTQIGLSGQFGWEADEIQVDRLAFGCDVGDARLTGPVHLSAAEAVQALARQPWSVHGQLDLAKLARMLPNTLRLREDVELQTGRIQLDLESTAQADQIVWSGKLEAADLAAMAAGRPVVWEQPIRVSFSGHDGPAGLVLQSLDAESDFLQLNASGNPREMTLAARFDLAKLAQQAGQLVDLGAMQLAGNGTAQFKWRLGDDGSLALAGRTEVQQWQFVREGRPGWIEPRLAVDVSIAGRETQRETEGVVASLWEIATATLTIRTDAEQVEARLSRPIVYENANTDWPLTLSGKGPLDPWPGRIALFTDAFQSRLAGQYTLGGQLIARTNGTIRFDDAVMDVQPFLMHGFGLYIDEPRAIVEASGLADATAGRFEISSGSIRATAIAATITDLVFAMPANEPFALSGAMVYQGDVNRLQGWTTPADKPSPWQFHGNLTGTAQLQPIDGAMSTGFDATVQQFVAAGRGGRTFEQSSIRLYGRADYQSETSQLVVPSVRCDSTLLRAALQGRYAMAEATDSLQLEGQVAFEQSQLDPLIDKMAGSRVKFAGVRPSPIAYRGAFDPTIATGSTALGWQQADLYGFLIGEGRMQFDLGGGRLRLEPVDLAASEGRLHLDGSLGLVEEPLEMVVPKGILAENVRINPSMCENGLKYIAPALAGVTAANGRFSIDLDRCRVPIDLPEQGKIVGRMTVHSVDVGPGPMLQEIANLLGYTAPVRLARESVVSFRMADGRIHHRDLELLFGDATVRTRGSVGFDQTIEMVAEMPIPAKWLGANVLGSAMQGQTVSIPIRGTLSQPKLDQKALRDLLAPSMRTAAANVLETQVAPSLREAATNVLETQVTPSLREAATNVLETQIAPTARTGARNVIEKEVAPSVRAAAEDAIEKQVEQGLQHLFRRP